MSNLELLALIGVVGIAIVIAGLSSIRTEIRGLRGQVENLIDEVAMKREDDEEREAAQKR